MNKVGKGTITADSRRFTSKSIDEYKVIRDVYTQLKGNFDRSIANHKTNGSVPFDRISMRGMVFENGQCTQDVVLKNNISSK